ncbi:MAG: hypothetical protein NC299_09815 [Lachnospiraceae bacterium]|nr:hypothetical protein [Ruminococcus sp.]MCM1275650.1 hypothetical protein [Lachnospiraceae bacterium]
MLARRSLRWYLDKNKKDELRVFSTFDLKKIRRFMRKNPLFYSDVPIYDDFYLKRMVCLLIVMAYPYSADIHVLIWAVIWLSSHGCWVPRGK